MKILEAGARMFGRTWVCQKCKHKQKADGAKVRAKQIICRNCHARCFRAIHKEKRVVGA